MSGDRWITIDEGCLDGGARWNDCRFLSGASCGIGGGWGIAAVYSKSVGAFSLNGQDPVVVVGVAATGVCGRMVFVVSVSG